MATGADQRRYVRVPVERPAYVTTPTNMRQAKTVWSHELGEGGCLLVNEDYFGVGRVLIVDIILDSQVPIRAIGQVRHEYRDDSSQVYTGFEFQHMACEHAEKLKCYIHARVPPMALKVLVGNA